MGRRGRSATRRRRRPPRPRVDIHRRDSGGAAATMMGSVQRACQRWRSASWRGVSGGRRACSRASRARYGNKVRAEHAAGFAATRCFLPVGPSGAPGGAPAMASARCACSSPAGPASSAPTSPTGSWPTVAGSGCSTGSSRRCTARAAPAYLDPGPSSCRRRPRPGASTPRSTASTPSSTSRRRRRRPVDVRDRALRARSTRSATRAARGVVDRRAPYGKLVVASSWRSTARASTAARPAGRRRARLRPGRGSPRAQWECTCPTCAAGSAPARRRDAPLGPTSVYAITKRDQEELCLVVGARLRRPDGGAALLQRLRPRRP